MKNDIICVGIGCGPVKKREHEVMLTMLFFMFCSSGGGVARWYVSGYSDQKAIQRKLTLYEV